MTTISVNRPRLWLGRTHLAHHKIELAWGVFAAANYAAMLAWPRWEMVP
jgi:hypothetical protein